jgi:hypothetical protein
MIQIGKDINYCVYILKQIFLHFVTICCVLLNIKKNALWKISFEYVNLADKTAYCLSPEAAIAAGQLVASGEEKAAWAKDRSSWAMPGKVWAAHALSA